MEVYVAYKVSGCCLKSLEGNVDWMPGATERPRACSFRLRCLWRPSRVELEVDSGLASVAPEASVPALLSPVGTETRMKFTRRSSWKPF